LIPPVFSLNVGQGGGSISRILKLSVHAGLLGPMHRIKSKLPREDLMRTDPQVPRKTGGEIKRRYGE